MSLPDDLGHGLHDTAGPEVVLGEVSPVGLDEDVVLRGVVKIRNIQEDLLSPGLNRYRKRPLSEG